MSGGRAMEAEKRYRRLGLEDALHRPRDYAVACRELSVLLRRAYSKLPKTVQTLLFHDTLAAFRLLPLQSNSVASFANLLYQAVEAVLPKQRKVLAISEFKRAVVALKRRAEAHQDFEGLVQLPDDVLTHIFGFLDLRSLAASSLVCRTWMLASNDEILWRLQYFLFFGKNEEEHPTILDERGRYGDGWILAVDSSWRNEFTRKITGKSWSLASGRGICACCKSIIWLSGLTCTSPHQCPRNVRGSVMMKPISSSKVAEYLLGEMPQSAIWSDSDSDSDESSLPEVRLHKLWAYPEHISAP